MKPTNTELAIKKRHPEGVALIVCKDEKGMVDVTPGWFMLCSSDPSCWAIALYHKHYSHKVISETKEFALCLPSGSQKNDILYCGSVHGWDTDKLKKCKLRIIPSKKVSPPIIADSIACFECKVIGTYKSEKTDKIYNNGSKNLFDWKIQ